MKTAGREEGKRKPGRILVKDEGCVNRRKERKEEKEKGRMLVKDEGRGRV